MDYQAVFRRQPGVLALLTPDGVILDVNDGFLEAAGRGLEQVIGRNLFDAFPDNPRDPGDPGSTGPARLRDFEERYWTVVNTPVRRDDGRIALIAHKSDEVTHIVNQGRNLLADQG